MPDQVMRLQTPKGWRGRTCAWLWMWRRRPRSSAVHTCAWPWKWQHSGHSGHSLSLCRQREVCRQWRAKRAREGNASSREAGPTRIRQHNNALHELQ
eukprot:6067183-Alexandrium_andersonii.AAC.1